MSADASHGMHRLRIKICGVTEPDHVAAVAESGADLIGFVFHPPSPRAVTLERAALLAEAAGARGLERVALVVDPEPSLLRAIAATGQFDRVQFHGGESARAIGAARTSAGLDRPTIKGFRFSPTALSAWNASDAVDWLLLDGPSGGGGEPFDHRTLQPLVATITKPWLLAGGLTPESVGEAIDRLRPWGVDVSSGVERQRGVKDPERIAAFCRAARAAERADQRTTEAQRAQRVHREGK